MNSKIFVQDDVPDQDKTRFDERCKNRDSLLTTLHMWLILAYMAIGHYLPFLRVEWSIRTISRLLSGLKQQIPDLRASLRIDDVHMLPTSGKHTHPNSATERTATSGMLSDVVRRAGLTPYFVSMAAADQRENERGCRYFYWPKDLKADFRDDVIQSSDVLIFIDVDFHCDMEEYLKRSQPILMYTLVPEFAAYRGDEHSYRICDDVVHYRVSGGAEYKHKIWDYDHEILAVDCDDSYTTFFNVEQRKCEGSVGGGRRVVSLIPFVRVPTVFAYLLNPVYLERKTYTQNGVNIVYNDITDAISVSLNNSYHSLQTTGRRIEAIKQRLLALNKATFSVGDIEQYLYDETEERTKTVKVDAALLYSFFNKTLDFAIEGNVISTSNVKCTYTPTGPFTSIDDKKPCQVLTPPLVTSPGLFPTKNINSEMSAIAGRINRVNNFVVPPRIYGSYAREFVSLLVPTAHVGVPLDMDTVKEMQNRPMQRARTAQVSHLLGVLAPNRLKTFNKSESYPSANDPRIITTCDPRLTLEMSRFTYAFKNSILKKLSWYGPGKTPTESVKILRRLATDGAIETDFTRFDGSISKFLQERIVFEAYLKWTNFSEKDLMLHYLKQVFVKKGKTSSGLKYAAGWGTRSGSPITTDGNTMINAFISFSALRNLGYKPSDAWKHLGIYAGDDGINEQLPGFAESIACACKDLGLDVKMEVRNRGDPITYLSRKFPSILTHDDSHQDITRTLSKIHLSANKNVSREQAAANKAHGYLVTDGLTPIIGDYCRRVLQITGLQAKNMLSEEVFRVENGAWPQSDAQLLMDSVCKDLNLTTAELESKIFSINKVTDLDSFPLVINNIVEHKIEAFVAGEYTRPRNKNNNNNQDNGGQQEQPNQDPRRGHERSHNGGRPVRHSGVSGRGTTRKTSTDFRDRKTNDASQSRRVPGPGDRSTDSKRRNHRRDGR